MIRLFSPFIPDTTPEKVAEIIRSGWVNRGEKAKLFEDLFKEKFSYKYALSLNSCTSALRLAYAIVGVGYGDEVITTPYTMIATNTAILEQGGKPVFADVKYETANLDPADIEHRITEKTKAIACVHYGGYPCDMDEICGIAHEHGLSIIGDCAQALGAKYKGVEIGNCSDFATFSFQVVKHINTVDGGMFVTNNKEHYEEAIRRSWFGIDKKKRVKSALGDFPSDIKEVGYKYAMNDINASMGIEGLRFFDNAFNRRREIAEQYREELDGVKGLTLMEKDHGKDNANWLFSIHVNHRLKFALKMREAKIEVAVHNWRNDKYSIFGGPRKDLPNTERLNEDIINIPLHHNLSQSDVNYIISKIKDITRI